MKILLFAGAGTSIELGVPGMVGLGEAFLEHTQQWDVEPALVQNIMGGSRDIEHLIDALDRICAARPSLEVIGIDTIPLMQADKLRAEVEWFVQHAAERIVGKDAKLMWGSVLRAAASHDITLVTTNYDRAIELAGNAENIPLIDGFGPFTQGETVSWVGFENPASHLSLVKLHGSTDWYATGESASPTKLRHPMPLFGRALLRLADGQELGSALVLPSREKLLTHEPYPRLSQAFLNAADCCDMAVFVGSSLRDPHIRGAAETTAQRAPVFVVNPSGDNLGLHQAVSIRQYASTFLIATLPNALLTEDPVKALRAVTEPPDGHFETLITIRQALDTELRPSLRCQSIDRLDDMGVTLDPFLLRILLNDNDPTVARYSLGLISLSSAREALFEEALATQHADNPAFSEDLALLGSMLQH